MTLSLTLKDIIALAIPVVVIILIARWYVKYDDEENEL